MVLALTREKIAAIEDESTRLPIARVALFLQENLGQRITAYLSGLTNAKVVGMWARGAVDPHPQTQMRLRHAYQAARMIVGAYGSETAKSWFFGTNTRLDDQAPAYVLRNAGTPGDLRFVVPSARAFAGAVD